jgi:hypothetical protein
MLISEANDVCVEFHDEYHGREFDLKGCVWWLKCVPLIAAREKKQLEKAKLSTFAGLCGLWPFELRYVQKLKAWCRFDDHQVYLSFVESLCRVLVILANSVSTRTDNGKL